MKLRKYLIVGNWKMNPTNYKLAKDIFAKIKRNIKSSKRVNVVICPPSIFLGFLKGDRKILLGVQDIFYEESGAFTGMISGAMAKSVGAEFAIIGHSERRALGESDVTIARKIQSCLKYKLTPIVCLGESKRDISGSHFEYLKRQILNTFAGIKKEELSKIVIAYEPVWAIGRASNEAMKPIDVHEATIFIKKVLSDFYGGISPETLKILYGGSVDKNNAKSIILDGGVDGLLIGRESLEPNNFSKIVTYISNDHR
jgi:triosephosphate isomerase